MRYGRHPIAYCISSAISWCQWQAQIICYAAEKLQVSISGGQKDSKAEEKAWNAPRKSQCCLRVFKPRK